VDTANLLIANNPRRMEKACFSKKPGGTVKTIDFMSDDEEARWVAGALRALFLDEGLDWGEMAVLYRTKFLSLPFEKALRSAGIPYQMLGGKGFFERKEILDINCYLTAAVFDRDDAAFERIVNTPKRGVGPSMIQRISGFREGEGGLRRAAGKAVEQKALSAKAEASVRELLLLLGEIGELSPAGAIERVLSATGYLEHLRQYAKTGDDYTARVENIDQLIYAASVHESLIDYLEEAALVKEDHAEEAPAQRVSLATMHASKGLEFRAVFVAGCEENLLPHWKSRETPAEIEEERRLMYVAMTRAAEYLFLTSAEYRKGQYNPQSRFLQEIAD
jgi:DNA helicase-2/ATP-dependent DNA helicase PcrA